MLVAHRVIFIPLIPQETNPLLINSQKRSIFSHQMLRLKKGSTDSRSRFLGNKLYVGGTQGHIYPFDSPRDESPPN